MMVHLTNNSIEKRTSDVNNENARVKRSKTEMYMNEYIKLAVKFVICRVRQIQAYHWPSEIIVNCTVKYSFDSWIDSCYP